ncbi:SDR family oxidoreductase [Paraburkholderia caribensis]|uniref:Short-chain dehydrogenase/reductase SDR n=2 Tax=Paraburkholderia TaxID=1822464 RepID=B2JY48_PARP8|nr:MULTISPECIES: SDR family oxidoreductase [Paraburkholderia]ACC76556.1 short-chain dehydrogenase/reductase SDR [Paraburkholderia phymatum STM815]MCO4881994.1 SDR family oxidoreductase [Paraburkholderia caribensis]PTB24580.1 KR domain-containing protein [Paraburkholderia caribensis]
MKNHDIVAISGGTSGIGRSLAESAIERGSRVVVSGRRGDRIHAFCETHSTPVPRACGVVSDASDSDHANRIFDESQRTFGATPTAYVLCAGRGLSGTITTSDETQWEELLRVNLLGAMRQLRACAERFNPSAKTSTQVRDIVVIGSTVGRVISAANPVYGATKFALHSLVESLRQEMSSRNTRVTLIEPGFVKTEFQTRAGYDMERFSQMEQEQGPFLAAVDVVEAIWFVLERPPHVHIDDIRIRPTRQRV